MRYGGGRWHSRTNKYLFRILHSTPLQRVWFPGSTALLMHPSTQYSYPQSTEIMEGTEREQVLGEVKSKLMLYRKANDTLLSSVANVSEEKQSVQFFTYMDSFGVRMWLCEQYFILFFCKIKGRKTTSHIHSIFRASSLKPTKDSVIGIKRFQKEDIKIYIPKVSEKRKKTH